MTNRISIDIDGILNDYPVYRINYVNIELNTQFCSREEIKDKIGKENYKKIIYNNVGIRYHNYH